MPRHVKLLLVALRALAGATLLVGLLIWTGRPVPWTSVHMGLGVLLGLTLIVLGVVVTRLTGRMSATLIAVGWTVLLIAYGVAHARLWPGDSHWIAQLLHVLIGLATLGVAERMVRGVPAVVATPHQGG